MQQREAPKKNVAANKGFTPSFGELVWPYLHSGSFVRKFDYGKMVLSDKTSAVGANFLSKSIKAIRLVLFIPK